MARRWLYNPVHRTTTVVVTAQDRTVSAQQLWDAMRRTCEDNACRCRQQQLALHKRAGRHCTVVGHLDWIAEPPRPDQRHTLP